MTIMSNHVVAVLTDLMFMVKIQDTAKRLELQTKVVKAQADVFTQALAGAALIIIDLNFAQIEPLELISLLKANEETRKIPLLGYVSHVQVDLRNEAQRRGCDTVVARSVFVETLPKLLAEIKPARCS
jgi:CheY-like chemotaxis protein